MQIIETHKDGGLIIVKPLVPTKTTPGDPYGDACMIAETDWLGKFGAKTLVWDTATWRAKTLLSMAASLKKYGDNIQFGSGGRLHTMPAKGDFGAAQSMMLELRSILMAQPLHLVLIGHQTIAEYENDTGIVASTGGFGLVGKASVGQFGDVFDQYLRMYVDQPPLALPGQAGRGRRVMLQLKKGPLFDAGIRTTEQMPDAIEVPATLEGQRALWTQLLGWFRIQGPARLRMGIYGPPKVGKTQFITSLPDHLKPLIYVADDPGSEAMLSTFPAAFGGGSQSQKESEVS